MKALLHISFFFFALNIAAQDIQNPSKYQQGMQKAFQLWQEGKTEEAANLFERIANTETDNWLPPYYAAQIYIVNSFSIKDGKELAATLKRAQNFINDATAISKENSDILVLQAQLYTSWIIFDGQRFGMQYSPKAAELYNKAVAISPDNPRAILARAEWNMGSAQYFGESVKKYCDEIAKAIELFENAPAVPEFYPTYGKERAEQIQKASCQ